ncbi:MAG TPA: cupin domain-containing protein [Terriglobia bacterium]|nr:cupin domain-containing protein [Terriglobia bacterium]
MKTTLLFLAYIGTTLTFACAAEEKASQVLHFDHEKVAALFEKGGPLLTTNTFKIQAGRRTSPGEVEIHAHDTDIFYIVEGSATFVTGGTAIEPKIVSEGETRAKEISGGQARRLVKGDVIVIPTGVPHWFKEVDGLFLYYVVKVVDQKR